MPSSTRSFWAVSACHQPSLLRNGKLTIRFRSRYRTRVRLLHALRQERKVRFAGPIDCVHYWNSHQRYHSFPQRDVGDQRVPLPACGTADFAPCYSFDFNNGTDNAILGAINIGNIYCIRADTDGWYAKPPTTWYWLFFFVPCFALLLALASLQPVRRREFVVMIAIACAGWATNNAAGRYIYNRVRHSAPN